MYCQTLGQWHVKQFVLSESYQAHGFSADRVFDELLVSVFKQNISLYQQLNDISECDHHNLSLHAILT